VSQQDKLTAAWLNGAKHSINEAKEIIRAMMIPDSAVGGANGAIILPVVIGEAGEGKSMMIKEVAEEEGHEFACEYGGGQDEEGRWGLQHIVETKDGRFESQHTEALPVFRAPKSRSGYGVYSIEEIGSSTTETKNQIREMLEGLEEKEAIVLKLRFGLEDDKPRTLQEIGDIFGLTRERIRQIEKKAMRKLSQSHKLQQLRGYLN